MPALPRSLHRGGDERVLRQRRSCAIGTDVDGCRDDRQPGPVAPRRWLQSASPHLSSATGRSTRASCAVARAPQRGSRRCWLPLLSSVSIADVMSASSSSLPRGPRTSRLERCSSPASFRELRRRGVSDGLKDGKHRHAHLVGAIEQERTAGDRLRRVIAGVAAEEVNPPLLRRRWRGLCCRRVLHERKIQVLVPACPAMPDPVSGRQGVLGRTVTLISQTSMCIVPSTNLGVGSWRRCGLLGNR